MVIGPNGEQLGVKPLQDALTLANAAGFDLVQMGGKPEEPVCKLMDYNKYKYERNKKLKEAQKNQRAANKDVKEYRLSVNIDIHDFDTRVKNAKDYLIKGHKVKGFLRFKGRSITHPELGQEVLLRFAEALSDVSTIESQPKMEGRQMFMLLAPKKDK
jgi:translation initiation factor IF-3